MSDELVTVTTSVVGRIVRLIQEDSAFREQLRALAQVVLALTEQPPMPTTEVSPPILPPCAESASVPEPSPAPLPKPVVEAAVSQPGRTEVTAAAVQVAPSLAIAQPPSAPFVARPATPAGLMPEVTDADLPVIEQRLRMKAEGARWVATRRRRITEGADFKMEIDPLDREIIERAKKMPDCFLWTNHSTGPAPSDLTLLDNLAGCFDTAADAVALVRGILGETAKDDGTLERGLELLAEAQSALRAAVARVGYGQADRDQVRVFCWLRDTAWRIQFYFQRHMRVDDMADPASWSAIDARIEQFDGQVQQARQWSRQYQSAIKRMRYHLKPIVDGRDGDRQHDWQVVVQTVVDMVQCGVPPSNTDIRELLLPVIEVLPELDMPPEFRLVLREIDTYLATRPSATGEEAQAEPSDEVKRARELLAGTSVVLIGGIRRPQAHEALKAAFGLSDLDWVETKEHESVANFESHVARPEVALVILAIRWSSHAFSDVRQYCERYGKPLVRLPAGYNPNQVAVQVLNQCGERLAAK